MAVPEAGEKWVGSELMELFYSGYVGKAQQLHDRLAMPAFRSL